MIVDDVARFLSITVQLLGDLAWPVVLLLLAARFHEPITGFLKNISQFKVRALGVEASVTRQREQAVAALGAAVAKRGSASGGSVDTADFKAITDALPSPTAQQRLERSRVLWVDDNPDNNRFERQALEALGVWVEISTSTADALTRTQAVPYDLIISDMTREPDPQAGYTLLGKLRERGAVDYLNDPAALVGRVTMLLGTRTRP